MQVIPKKFKTASGPLLTSRLLFWLYAKELKRMSPKSQKLRQDAKALLTACKAILTAATNGIPTEVEQTEINTKRNEADAMLKAAEQHDAVDSGLELMGKPVRSKTVDIEDITIDEEQEGSAELRIREVGWTHASKKALNRIGLFCAGLAVSSHIPDIRNSVNDRTKQKVHDTFGDINALHFEGSNIPGGSLVLPEFDTMMINLRELFGSFRRNMNVKSMGSETKDIFRRTGGLQAYLVGEAKSITASSKKWDRVKLQAKLIGALTASTMELNDDAAIDLASDLTSELAYAFALSEDQAGWNGDGTTGGSVEYLGMLGLRYKLRNLSATISKIYGLTLGSGSGHTTDYTGLVIGDFNGVQANLPAYADTPGCKWYCHRSFYFGVMVKLAVAAGGTQLPQMLSGDGIKRFQFLGYPVEFVQAFPKTAAASQVCALFGDINLAAKMGERKGLEFSMSTDATISDGGTSYPLWQNKMIGWRAIERIDINVHDVGTNSDIVATPTVDIPGAGPVVGLITAAS